MVNVEQMKSILDALPDPAFILSRTGKYVAVFGGRDKRYYHDGSGLVGLYLSDLIKPEKANWFLEQIDTDRSGAGVPETARRGIRTEQQGCEGFAR